MINQQGRRTKHTSIIVATLLTGGCHANVQPAPDPCPSRTWAKVPLQPPLHFDRPGPPGVLTFLILDAHSGASVINAQVGLRGGLPYMTTRTDSTGTAVFENLSAGRYEIRTNQVGYGTHRDSVELGAGEGRTRVVQLQRYGVCLSEVLPTR